MVFRRADIAAPCFPVRAEFIYGEWLRDAYESGELPAPVIEPENTLVLAQARQEAVSLFGPDARELLPSVPPQQIRRAMFEVISAFGTVGLSTGITGGLPPAAQLVIIALMFIGRVGTITIASALALQERNVLFRYPEERPIVG